jgi:hypothetical protein
MGERKSISGLAHFQGLTPEEHLPAPPSVETGAGRQGERGGSSHAGITEWWK